MTLTDLSDSFTVGFIAAGNGTSYGTCFIAELRDEKYLVTDCHVIYNRKKEDLYADMFSARLTNQSSNGSNGYEGQGGQDDSLESIFYFLPNHQDGLNVFDLENNWIGYCVKTEIGYNFYNCDTVWMAFIVAP